MRRCSREDGAALLLALVVVLVASLLGLGMANLTVSSASFSNASAADRQLTYAANGAADWGISQVVQALNAGQDPPCAPASFPDFPSVPMTVSCSSPARGAGTASTTTTTASDSSAASAPVTDGPVTYDFTVKDSSTGATYVTASVTFSAGLDGQVHGSVKTWEDKPAG